MDYNILKENVLNGIFDEINILHNTRKIACKNGLTEKQFDTLLKKVNKDVKLLQIISKELN